MPSLLLITEQRRVRQLFAGLEQEGLFRLRLAPTLAQAEEELVSRLPHYVFVENGTSGLPAAEIARLLRGLLPEECQVVLLARGKEDLPEVQQVDAPFYLDLSESDQVLREKLRELFPAALPEETATPADPGPAQPRTPRDMLFSAPPEVATAQPAKLWLIPLALALAALAGGIAWYARKAPPAAVPHRSAADAPRAVVIPKSSSAPGPAASSGSSGAAAGNAGTASGGASRPKEVAARYVVQRGDSVVKILMRHFGYSYRDAIRMMPEVKRLNGQRDLEKLKLGETLIIPARAAGREQPR